MSVFQDDYVELLEDLAGQSPEVAGLVREALPRVQAMLQVEDRGWVELFSGRGGVDSPEEALRFAKEVSELSREMCYGSPLIDRGLDLRSSYVWSKGIVIEGVSERTREGGARRGPKSRLERFFADPKIRRYLLSAEGHKDLEAAAFNDGAYFFLGDDARRTGHPVPISEIDGVFTNPDYSGEVWAYRRTFTRYLAGGEAEKVSEWVYVDTFKGSRVNPEGVNAKSSVATGKTFFVKSFNTMVGDAVGVPDSLPALKWARIYAEMVNDGRVVSKANAKFAMKVRNASAQGAQGAAARLSTAKGVGQAAAMGKDQDLVSLPQSNRVYDFGGLRPIASMVATALSVSVIHILSDPGAAGSSYGSAQNLDLPTKRAMASRQAEWVAFLERILEWGTGESLSVVFASLDEPDAYREGQLVTLGWNTGLIHEDEARARMLEVAGFEDMHDGVPPAGVMLPNNEDSLARGDVDADGVSGGGSVPVNALSPDQGKRNGTGGVSDSSAQDLRGEELLSRVDLLQEQLGEVLAVVKDLG